AAVGHDYALTVALHVVDEDIGHLAQIGAHLLHEEDALTVLGFLEYPRSDGRHVVSAFELMTILLGLPDRPRRQIQAEHRYDEDDRHRVYEHRHEPGQQPEAGALPDDHLGVAIGPCHGKQYGQEQRERQQYGEITQHGETEQDEHRVGGDAPTRGETQE